MSPEFSFVISRSSMLCLTGVGLSFLLLLGVLIAYLAIDSFRASANLAPEHPWARLARQNQLNFDHRYSLFGLMRSDPQVTGVYRSHPLYLALHSGKNEVYTLLTVSANPGLTASLPQISWSSGIPFTVDDLFTLIAPQDLPASWQGTISIDQLGQKAVYREEQEENDETYLQAIFDLACDVLEGYAQVTRLGGVAVPALTELAKSYHPLRHIAIRCLYYISQETQERLESQAKDLLCSNCLVHPAQIPVQLSWTKELKYFLVSQPGTSISLPGRLPWEQQSYYGCRQCGQSQQFIALEGRRTVVVLDEAATEDMIEQSDQLRVDWFAHPQPFDFDEVEIIQANDETVERFAVQLGNDTDPIRRPHYRQMRCRVARDCFLSPNTVRILHRTFGEVKEYTPS